MFIKHPTSSLFIPSAMEKNGRVFLQRGISLVELIMFMVIISIAVSGVLLVMNNITGHSADALVRKQALAIAESLLEEIELQALAGAGCAGTLLVNAARTGASSVCDYNGYSTNAGILDFATNMPVPGLGNYNVNPAVAVNPTTVAWGGVPAGSAVVISVSVTGPGGQVVVTGYRAAY